MNKFTCVLLLGTALLAGCVDREGYYNSVREALLNKSDFG